MKRILILLLVVGLTSVVSAGVGMDIYVNNVLTGDGGAVTVGDTVKVVITATAPLAYAAGGGFAEFNIDVSAGTYNSDAVLTELGPYAPTFSPWEQSLPAPTLIWTADGSGGGLKINALPSSLAGPATAGDMAWFTFTATGGTTIDPDYGSFDQVFHSDAAFDGVTLVPEPMTIALLGLGGLFLRRRK